MATGDEPASQPDIVAAMLTNQTSACKPAREAIAAGAEVTVWDREVPHSMVAGIAAARLRRSLARGLQEIIGLDETVEILARHRGEQLRTGIIDATDRLWFFTLYFDAAGTELLACSGVKRSRRPSTKDSFEP
ncbi:hypothetical protein [Streptomyces sp. NPDC058694]|uniref:hypothetical protein n=1 Tax=Streptomyces sp. NPDC058694 TaxID=3346603 RepID=UPI003658D457